jgi:DNA-binding response OmpR family regulator
MTMTLTTPIKGRPERPALRRALESVGFLVFEASANGGDRERLREFWGALILFNLPMSRMGGLEVFRRLRGAGDDDPEAIILTNARIPETTTVVRLGLIEVSARPLGPEAVRLTVEGILRPAAGPRSNPPGPRVLVAVEPLMLEMIRAKRALDCLEFDDAERMLRAAIAMDPESTVAHYLMGQLHLRLGEHRAAYHSFKAALRADPRYEPAREHLRRQCRRLGLDFVESSEQPPSGDPFGQVSARIGMVEPTRWYQQSRRDLGLDSAHKPRPGPSRKRG